jgi:hypothetical protein
VWTKLFVKFRKPSSAPNDTVTSINFTRKPSQTSQQHHSVTQTKPRPNNPSSMLRAPRSSPAPTNALHSKTYALSPIRSMKSYLTPLTMWSRPLFLVALICWFRLPGRFWRQFDQIVTLKSGHRNSKSATLDS